MRRPILTVPQGATTLYVGTMDATGWYKNAGEFNVRIDVTPAL